MEKEKKINLIAEFQYNWLKEFLKPLFNKLNLENVRNYKRYVTHQRKVKFSDLNPEYKQIYLKFSNDFIKWQKERNLNINAKQKGV